MTDTFDIRFDPPIDPAGRTYRNIPLDDRHFISKAIKLSISWEVVYWAGQSSFSGGRGQMISVLSELVHAYRASKQRSDFELAPLGEELGRIEFRENCALFYDLYATPPDKPIAHCEAAQVERCFQEAVSTFYHRMLEYMED